MNKPNSEVYLRVDASFEFGEPKTTEEGYLIVPGVAATTGILEYTEPDGSTRRELVTPDALEDPSSLVGKPVTLEHPPEGEVNPENFKDHVVGEVVDARFDEESGKVHVKIRIKDAEAIRAVRSGTKELSPGYKARILDESGDSDHGEYDVKQIARVNNHLAITEAGRGGEESAIRLDSQGNAILNKRKDEAPMKDGNEETEEKQDQTDAGDKIAQLGEKVDRLTEAVMAMVEDQGGGEEPDGGGEESAPREDSADRMEWFQQRKDALETADRLDVEVDESASVLEIKRSVVEEKGPELRNDSEAHIEVAFDMLDTSEEDRTDSEEDLFNETDFLRPSEEPAQKELRDNLSGGSQ